MHWLSTAWWWFEVHSGTVHESGPYYGFFSGFGSDLGELTLIGAVIVGYRKVNCHEPHCFRIAHHEYAMNGVTYKFCRKHMPGVDHKNRVRATDAADHYRTGTVVKPRRAANGRFQAVK